MSPAGINHLNSALMMLACALAFLLPFELFLFSYAVLGPLHYLTQISWLHERGYFVKRRSDAILLAGLSALMLVAALAAGDPDRALQLMASIGCVAFASAIAMAFTKAWLPRLLVPIGLGLALLLVRPESAWFLVLFGVFLVTVVHVFFYTGCFIVVGALKTGSWSALLSVLVLLACAASFFVLGGAAGPVASDYVQQAYAPFVMLSVELTERLGFLGLAPLRVVEDVYRSPSGLAVGRFIAFAYTYHYLNWFSKTKVIGWHEIPRRRALVIVALWIVSVTVYAVDYRVGIAALFGLSVLHVFLEFPLDHQALVGIVRQTGARLRG